MAGWPKSARFTLTQRLDNHVLDVVEMLVQARYEPGVRRRLLPAINLRLERMRFLLRLARDSKVGKSSTCDCSIASRPSTVVWGKTSVRICSVRLAVITTSAPVVCARTAPLAKDNTAIAEAESAGVKSALLRNGNAKRRARIERFFI